MIKIKLGAVRRMKSSERKNEADDQNSFLKEIKSKSSERKNEVDDQNSI